MDVTGEKIRGIGKGKEFSVKSLRKIGDIFLKLLGGVCCVSFIILEEET